MTSHVMDRSKAAFAEALQGGSHSSISPEMLEAMGKEAANKFLGRNIPLNEAISKIAGSYPDISHEQVKRVCEFANTSVYLARHDQAKTAGAGSSYPQFDLADPARVIHDLNDGARPTSSTPTDVAYSRQASKSVEKTASADAEVAFNDLFLGGAKEVTTHTKESAVEDVFALKESLVSTKDHLKAKGQELDSMFKEASEEYYELAKRHLIGGGSFTDLLSAAQSISAPTEKIAEVITQFTERLMAEKIASASTLKAACNDLEKVAHRVVNEKHQFVTTFGALVDLDQQIEKVAVALKDIDSPLAEVKAFIKENFHARASS